jgi:peptide/nickel transport system substrate-binding protein
MMRKLTVILLSVAIALLGLATVSLAKDPQAYWNTPQEYEKVTGNKIEKFYEAPMLRTMVAAGEILPVEKRLPEDPQVIKPVEEIGQYGGIWHTYYDDPGMGNLKMVLYDPGVRWNRDLTAYIPGLIKEWKFSPDGKTVTFYFRKGLKWSDGHPFTMEDLRFWWKDLATNKEYAVVIPAWWAYNADKTLAEIKFIDDSTVSFTFKEPHYLMPHILASGFWEWEPLMKPKHYLKQFHPRYNPEMKDYMALEDKDKWWQNPDYPTLFAWHVVEYKPGKRVTLERNPYYWKVDTAGNQLPYIDRMEAEYVKEPEVRLLKVLKGEYDAAFRVVVDDPLTIPLLKEKEEAGGYRVILWKNGAGGWPSLMVNHNYNIEKTKDKFMYNLLRDKKFKRALSYALNRERINDVVWHGMMRVQAFTVSKDSWHFVSPEGKKVWQEWANSYVEYNPQKANELLDEVGLNKRDEEGFRTRPDGSKLQIVVDITGWGGKDRNSEAAPVIKKNWEAVGIRTILNAVYGTPAEDARVHDCTYMIRFAHVAEMDLWTYPDWVFPTGDGERMWPGVVHWIKNQVGRYMEKPEPGSPEDRLIKLYYKGIATTDFEEQNRIIWDAVRIHIEEGPFDIGITGGQPSPIIVKNNFRNVPDFGILGPWAVGCPGAENPEQFFFKK